MSNSLNSISSLTEIVKQSVAKQFSRLMEETITELEAEFKTKLDARLTEYKKDAKDTANRMTLELLQKANINGISVEFKL